MTDKVPEDYIDRTWTPKQMQTFADFARTGFTYVPGSPVVKVRRNKLGYKMAQMMRDEWLPQYPLLPGAVSAFIQQSVSREWTVTGTPRRAAQAVDILNDTEYIGADETHYYGWDDFQMRRIMDWLTLGVNAFVVPWIGRGDSKRRGILQYVDPVEVTALTPKGKARMIKGRRPTKEKRWQYDEEKLMDEEIFFSHFRPVAGGMHFGPLVSAIPTARLLWLVREYDSAALDGRKIRDIILTADPHIRDALIEAVLKVAALWAGEADPSKHGVPIVSVNKTGGFGVGQKVSDMIHILGLANIPEAYDRDTAYFNAANEFSGLLGIQMRSWFSDPRGTNRALEQVNQERQRVQGPAYYCRQDQRVINRSGILGRTHFAYVEEVDVSFEQTRANILKTYAEGLEKLQTVLGTVVSPRSFLTYLQRLGLFLNDADLVEDILTLSDQIVKPQDMVDKPIDKLIDEQRERDQGVAAEEQMADAEAEGEAEGRKESKRQEFAPEGPEPTAAEQQVQRTANLLAHYMRGMPDKLYIPKRDEVVVDRSGNILERRRAVFPVAKVVQRQDQDKVDQQLENRDQHATAIEEDFNALADELRVK